MEGRLVGRQPSRRSVLKAAALGALGLGGVGGLSGCGGLSEGTVRFLMNKPEDVEYFRGLITSYNDQSDAVSTALENWLS